MTSAPTLAEHDSAASLEVVHIDAAPRRRDSGWYVRRTCPCHRGKIVSVRFLSRAEAEHCLAILDDDAKRRPR